MFGKKKANFYVSVPEYVVSAVLVLDSGHSEDAKLGEIDSSDLDFGDQLAVGQGTAVYKGRWISRNLTVAIKQVGGRIREEEVSFF